MPFFNQKEQVIKIELTNYGKYLYGQGKFKPEYYQFFDSDILYDIRYAALSERQSEINTRIKETARELPQYSFTGVETNFYKARQHVPIGREKDIENFHLNNTPEKHYSLFAPLGNGYVGTGSIPSWDLNLLHRTNIWCSCISDRFLSK